MKNITIIAAAAAFFAAVSCNNNLDIENPYEDSASGMTELTVSLPGITECETKATGQTAANESAINSCQVFVFRSDSGKLDASTYAGSLTASGEYSVKLKCTAGARKIYAVVNGLKDYTSTIKDETSLKALATDLKDNSVSSLFMVGSVSATLAEGACSVAVNVKRAAASVVLKKISVDMESAAYKGAGLFKVKKVYLLNVCGRTNFALDTKPSAVALDYWYAKLAEETDSAKKALITDDLATAVTIENGKSSSTEYTYYAYPNNCAHSTSKTFSQRATLLVVEAQLDGETYYYPLKLNSLESNKRYIITNLTVHRPGSKTPYEPVLFSSASANIKVADWAEGSSSNVEI